ncbi:hypothetical protein MGAD_16050 [Mycolicibacterium gadium]|uniref:Uncharacterized protein n=1 Tax=Mycolicibacterium gadium TaxID=1794 RepID=A0A7I7WJE8_MYCGU|nr:hypothetical protein MGAD_16050 [Mycolicibacterium gadium]
MLYRINIDKFVDCLAQQEWMREKKMDIKPRTFATLLGAGAVAAAIASAPGAAGASVTSTHDSGGSTTTQRPGHVSIYSTPPVVSPPKVWGSHSSPLFVLGD